MDWDDAWMEERSKAIATTKKEIDFFTEFTIGI
jgi:hypothetical protein